jgi:N-acetylmuramoyl-L-alanine amidase
MKTKSLKIFLFLPYFLSLHGCSHHAIAPEITAMHLAPMPVAKVTPKKKETIIVDAGHGGKDAGASSKRDKYEEKALTLETAYLISENLEKLGYKTILTRKNDIFVPLDTRADIANAAKADLFVSIHYNFCSSQDAEGVEVYYYKEDKKPLSPRVAKSKELGQEVLKKITTATGAESRGIKQANFAVVRQTKMPAILIEAGFLSNPEEREKIKDPKYLQALAQGIAHGVDKYLSTHED